LLGDDAFLGMCFSWLIDTDQFSCYADYGFLVSTHLSHNLGHRPLYHHWTCLGRAAHQEEGTREGRADQMEIMIVLDTKLLG
jgi:hypothetical protein